METEGKYVLSRSIVLGLRRATISVVSLCAALLLASGCKILRPAHTTIHYYILTTVTPGTTAPAVVNTGRRLAIWLEPIEMADYLRTKRMAVRTGSNELTYALSHEWAETLDYGISRVLAERLRQAPSAPQVILGAPHGQAPLCTLTVRVLACEGKTGQGPASVEFKAAWELDGPNQAHQQGFFQAKPATWSGQDYSQLAHGLSQATDELADVLIQALARQTNSPQPP